MIFTVDLVATACQAVGSFEMNWTATGEGVISIGITNASSTCTILARRISYTPSCGDETLGSNSFLTRENIQSQIRSSPVLG